MKIVYMWQLLIAKDSYKMVHKEIVMDLGMPPSWLLRPPSPFPENASFSVKDFNKMYELDISYSKLWLCLFFWKEETVMMQCTINGLNIIV